MASYNHVQTVTGTVWNIAHNLNSDAVAMDVYIDNGGDKEKIIPLKTRKVDNNNIEVTFNLTQTGNARIVI